MALIFAVGMVAGGALVVAFHAGEPHGPPGLQQMRHHWMMHLAERLNLTSDQQAKIEPILADAANRIQALHRDEVDRIAKIMDSANQQIEPLLTPAQQEELKQIRREREHAFSGHMGPGGPGEFPHNGPPPDRPEPPAP
jgi:Spy/CpxP family protein refolding chaperone